MFGKDKVTVKFLELQNLETQARLVHFHQVTNKLPDPRVSVAIKKVLGALVGVEWENGLFFVIRGSVAWWSEQGTGSQELSDLRRLREALVRGFRQAVRSQEASLTYFEAPI